MEVIHARCAGLDVHKETVVACVRIAEGADVRSDVQTFQTTTAGLFALADWLEDEGCTHAVMEATGVYWKPVWHVLSMRVELLLVNAAHVKNVPGRKTDVNDASWLADLLAHGLVRASFVPPTQIRELRDLTRTRKQIVRHRTQCVQRLQKVLEDANIKLASVISDVVGMSGRRILEAIVDGEGDPSALAALASTRLKASREELQAALTGFVTEHHRFMLRLQLDQIDADDAMLAKIEARAGDALEPFRAAVELLKTMPGVSDTTAQTLVAEIGVDMSRFATAGHLVSWAGLCPKNDQSAGRRRSAKLSKGDKWLKTALVQAAWGAVRARDSYEGALFRRIKSRRGPKKAIVAVAASMLRTAYAILRDGTPYKSLGTDHFDRVDRERAKRRHLRALERLGYSVEVSEAA